MVMIGFQNEETVSRKQLIKDNLSQFLLFTRSTNKGTIRTAQMLVEAKDPEEIAAIWIAATAFELSNIQRQKEIARQAFHLYCAAIIFLRERFIVWNHMMRRLVPDVLIPYPVLDNLCGDNAQTVMGLIQMNVLMIKSSYTILRYSSLSDEEFAKEHLQSLRL